MKLNAFILLITTLISVLMVVYGSQTVFGAIGQYGFTFPISELGNCGNLTECGNYCEKDNNLQSCMSFVKKYQITKDDVLTFTISELDNCQMGTDCRNFCNRDENITQCIDFADKYDLLSTSNLELAQKFQAAVGAGGGPGGCKSLEQCERYCDDSSHTDECLDYVGKKNLLPIEELEQVRRVTEGFRQGVETPGKCRDYTECNVYCADSGHFNECATYASNVGYFSSEQASEAKKFSSLLSQGATPGGCKSKDECVSFCNQPSNQNVCLQYAKEHNIPVQFSGPGGCSSVDSCTAYCMQHQDDSACKQYESSFKGPGGCSDKDSCTAFCKEHKDDPECQQYASQYRGFSGPGGCKDVTSCTEYCKSNPKDSACAQYAGQYSGGFSGPGGCTDVSSCTSYCKSNPKDGECQKYAGQ